MKVYTYHHAIDPGSEKNARQQRLVDLWRKNWTRYGWEPIVLNEHHAMEHRHYRAINHSEWLRNSVNEWPYLRCCYNKYLAMETVGGGLMADPDIMNYGFTPEDAGLTDRLTRMTTYDPIVPCVLNGTGEHWSRIATFFRNCAVLKAWGPNCLLEDLSDMTLFQDFYVKSNLVSVRRSVVDYADNCDNAKLVHFHGQVPGDRVEYILKTKPPETA